MVARLGDERLLLQGRAAARLCRRHAFAERLAREPARRSSSTSSSSTSTTRSPARSRSIAAIGVTFVTVHAYPKAMRAAVRRAATRR